MTRLENLHPDDSLIGQGIMVTATHGLYMGLAI
jgi:hypothetical protein